LVDQVIVDASAPLKEAPLRSLFYQWLHFLRRVAVPPVKLKSSPANTTALNVIRSYNCTVVAVISFVVCRE
jgi:hypothetical protein